MARKEKTVKQAEKKAAEVKSSDLEKLMLEEVLKLESGEEHSIQQLLAFARRYKKETAPKEDPKKK